MNKLIVTRVELKNKNYIFSGIYKDKGFSEIHLEEEGEDAGNIGDIYVGRVSEVVKNLNAAFVEYKKGHKAYLPLQYNKKIMTQKEGVKETVKKGDGVFVQLKKSGVKTKEPVLTGYLSFSGRYVVIELNKSGILFSKKIKDDNYKARMSGLIEKTVGEVVSENNQIFSENNKSKYETDKINKIKRENNDAEDKNNYNINRVEKPNICIIVRTNAYKTDSEIVLNEIRDMLKDIIKRLSEGRNRTFYSEIYKEDRKFNKILRDSYKNPGFERVIDEVVSDREELLKEIKYKDVKCILYKDDLLPLNKLYNIEGTFEEIKKKNIWLKSGGYIVIEYTEAMTVIDVNTGKFIKGKVKEDTFFKINKEACVEIARQLKLRNISGIIMIDFINMEYKENEKRILRLLDDELKKDIVKSVVVDITKLGVVEVTREKKEAPVYSYL